jgi:hypothetical protein
MAEKMVRDTHGREVNFDAATRLMDPLLLQQLESAGSYPDKQSFFEAYAQAHAHKFSQSFAPFTGGRW